MTMATLAGAQTLGVMPALVTALLLGLIHGLVPDEHTWPITFSYAVGSYSTRGGLRAGLLFSLTFTLQRAIACELAWLGLAHWMQNPWIERLLLIPIGLLMAIGGLLMRQRRNTRPSSLFSHILRIMPALHGFIAGWGFGAFALILYTTLAPVMPSPALGWLPGALFGLGTAIIQGLLGALFGRMTQWRSLDPAQIRNLATGTASRTLIWGGTAYLAAGCAALAWPGLTDWQLATGWRIIGLRYIDLLLVLAIATVVGIGLGGFTLRLHALTKRYAVQPGS